MGLSFNTNFTSSLALPPNLASAPLYVKINSIIDFLVQQQAQEFEDIRLKYTGPSEVRPEVIQNIIDEFGFEYITNLMGTISNYQFNTLLSFVSLLNLLKGSRQGLELVLILLGFDSVITEWWETSPPGEVETFDVLLLMNSSYVTDPTATVAAFRLFAQAYVFPILASVIYQFNFNLAQMNITGAGFAKTYAYSEPNSFLGHIPYEG